MGSLGNNGGGWPPDGGGASDDLPELPADWEIVVPDDASELADEAAVIRAELRAERRDTAQTRPGRGVTAGLRAPVLIMAVAVLVTLARLFTAAWPGPARPPTTQRSTPSTTGRGLPALDLIADTGEVVPLRGQLPAVILLVDGCDCGRLVADTAGAARPEIVVLTVTAGPAPSEPAAGRPAPPPAGTRVVRQLYDPAGELRDSFAVGPPNGTAATLLISGSGEVVRIIHRTSSVDQFGPDLSRL